MSSKLYYSHKSHAFLVRGNEKNSFFLENNGDYAQFVNFASAWTTWVCLQTSSCYMFFIPSRWKLCWRTLHTQATKQYVSELCAAKLSASPWQEFHGRTSQPPVDDPVSVLGYWFPSILSPSFSLHCSLGSILRIILLK